MFLIHIQFEAFFAGMLRETHSLNWTQELILRFNIYYFVGSRGLCSPDNFVFLLKHMCMYCQKERSGLSMVRQFSSPGITLLIAELMCTNMRICK